MGTLIRLLFFPMQLHKIIFHRVPLHWNKCFFTFFVSLEVFFNFFSLKITNLKNQICGGVWFKMEKPSDSVLNADRNFVLDDNKLQPALCSPLSSESSDRPF